jgi:hypothetical protein
MSNKKYLKILKKKHLKNLKNENLKNEDLKYKNFYNESFKNHIVDFTILKDNVNIINNNINFNVNKIKINIMIAIYLYNEISNRYFLTEHIFRHYKIIQKYFKKYADIEFTIVGSEQNLSKNLTLKYFDSNSYVEFNQDYPIYKNRFYHMLTDKIRFGMKCAYNKNPDILFWAGSNDYICFNFFKQIIEFYNPNQLQIYGIDNYFNGNNAVYYCKYNNNQIIDIPFFWHNGKFNYAGRHIYNYVGGIIGINKNVISVYPDILDNWNCDEGKDEKMVLDKNIYIHFPKDTIYKFESKNLFFINFKLVEKNKEISSFNDLYKVMKNDTIDNNGKFLNEHFLKISQNEYNYFKSLNYYTLEDLK